MPPLQSPYYHGNCVAKEEVLQECTNENNSNFKIGTSIAEKPKLGKKIDSIWVGPARFNIL